VSCRIRPPHCGHNGHIFYLLAPSAEDRDAWLAALNAQGVNAVSHYVPLHSAPAGLRYARVEGPLSVTDDIASRLIRLPLHMRLGEAEQEHVIVTTQGVIRGGIR